MSKDPSGQLANDLYSERVKRGTEPKYTAPVAEIPQQETSRLDNLGRGLSQMYEGVLKIPRFVYGLAAVPQNFLADQLDMPSLAANYDDFLKNTNTPIANSPLTMLDQLADHYKGDAEAYEKKTRKYDDNIISSIGKGNFKEAGSQILDQIVESAPSIAGMAMTSGAGSAANLGAVTKTLANGLPFMSQKNAELQDDQSIPEWKKPLVAGFNGLAEVMLDQKFGTQAAIEGVMRRFTNEGAEAALEAGKDIASSYIKKALSSSSKAVKPFLEGGIEEASTQFAQNMLDKYALGKDIDLMDGVADAAIVGSAMTGGISTAGNVASKIVQPKERSQVRDIEGQQEQLLNELSNPNLSPETKAGVEQLINDNHDTIESIAKKTQEAIAKLNPEQKKEVDELSKKVDVAEAVVNDPNVSEKVKEVAEKQVETLSKQIDAIKPLETQQETKTTQVEQEPVKEKETPTEIITQGIKSMIDEADSKGEKSDEIEFLRNYSNKEKTDLISDVDSYVRNDHDILNSILRDGEEMSLESVKKRTKRTSESAIKEQYNDLKEVYENLEKGIKASEFVNEKSDTKLYRNIFKNNDVFKNVSVGDVVSDPAFMSTTVDSEWAKNHNNVSSTLEINIPKGQKAKGLYVGKTEKEFILPRGTKLEITNIENKDGKQNITANLVDENTKSKEVAKEDISEKRTKEVLTKAEDDLKALKQVTNKPAKYQASVKRLTEAFKAKEISEQEFNDTKARFDDVIADSAPTVPKAERLNEEETKTLDNELKNENLTTNDFIQYERARAIEDANNATEVVQQPENDRTGSQGEVKPSETAQGEKVKEIQERRQSIKDRISQKLKDQRGNLSSGIDPSLLSDFIELGATYIEEGVVKASDFIKRFREDYKELGFDDKEISDEDIQGVFDQANKTLPAKNEANNERAGKLGVELKDTKGEKRTQSVVEGEATSAIKEGYDTPDLVERILNDKHKASDTEVAILAKYLDAKESEIKGFNRQIAEDGATMSKSEFNKLTQARDEALNEFQDTAQAVRKTGTDTARALNARKFTFNKEYSLENMITRKRQANGGQKLTSEELATLTKQYEELEATQKEYEAKVKKLEEDNAKLRASQTVRRSVTERNKKSISKAELKEERTKIFSDIRNEFAKIRKSGQAMSDLPYRRELAVIAKYTPSLLRNLAQEGIVNIQEVIDRIHEEFKDDVPELTKRDVVDVIAGLYDEVKPTKDKIKSDISILKTQARLLGQIEDLENGIKKVKPDSPTAKAKNAEIEALKARINELNQQEDIKLERDLESFKTRINKRIEELNKRISEGDFEKADPRPKLKLDDEALRLRRKYDKIKHEFDVEVARDQLNQRTKVEKLKDNLLNIASLPRALKASLDVSAVLRQGLFLTPHVGDSSNALKEMGRQAFSEENYHNWLSDLKHTDMYDLMKESELYIADSSDPKLLAAEEEFTSNLADKIPVIGKVVKASERAYTSYLNVLRTGVFTSEAQKLIERGYTFENNPKEFKSLAKVINVLSGRGDIPDFLGGKSPKILSTAFFSPRFMAARIQTLYLWADPRLSKNARIMAAKDIGSVLGTGIVFLSLAVLAGLKVERDPRSPNFLKLKDEQEKGNTYYDILGGLPRYVNMLAEMITGQKKSAKGGIIDLTAKGYTNPTRLSEGARFIRGKFSPLVGTTVNLMEGKDVIGQPYHLWPNVPLEFVPLPISDVKEAYKVGGITNSLKVFLPTQFGISASSYDPNKKN